MVTNLRRIAWMGVATLVAFVAGARAQQPGVRSTAQTPPPAATTESQAEDLLSAVRGATPLACELIVRSVGQGWFSGGWSRAPDAERDVREQARWAAERRDDPSIVPTLRAGLEDADACVRRASARLLGSTRHPAAIEALLDALQSPNPVTRQLAAVGLGYADDLDAVDPLLRVLRDDDAAVRTAAAWALGRIEDRRAVAPLTSLLLDDPDPAVRRAAALALGDILG